jgi:hypothetical protein
MATPTQELTMNPLNIPAHAVLTLITDHRHDDCEVEEDFLDYFNKPGHTFATQIAPLTFAIHGKLTKQAFNKFKANQNGIGATYSLIDNS